MALNTASNLVALTTVGDLAALSAPMVVPRVLHLGLEADHALTHRVHDHTQAEADDHHGQGLTGQGPTVEGLTALDLGHTVQDHTVDVLTAHGHVVATANPTAHILVNLVRLMVMMVL